MKHDKFLEVESCIPVGRPNKTWDARDEILRRDLKSRERNKKLNKTTQLGGLPSVLRLTYVSRACFSKQMVMMMITVYGFKNNDEQTDEIKRSKLPAFSEKKMLVGRVYCERFFVMPQNHADTSSKKPARVWGPLILYNVITN